MAIATLQFYHPWPLFGEKLSRQWDEIRDDTNSLAALVRAAYVDINDVAGEDDLSGWALGELDFRNRFRTFYRKSAVATDGELIIQMNTGTEAAPVWIDCLNFSRNNHRVVVTAGGGFEVQNGFYDSSVNEPIAESMSFSSSSEWIFNHELGTTPVLWNTFDDRDKDISPDRVDVSDPNTAYFYWGTTPREGVAIVSGARSAPALRIKDTLANGFNDRTNTLAFDAEFFYVSAGGPGNPVIASFKPGSAGVTDHGALSGLADDDHTQYTLEDGTRAFSGDQSMGSNKLTDLAAGSVSGDAVRFDEAITEDGANAFTGDQSMGGNKLTDLAAGSVSGDAVRFDEAITEDGANAFTGDQSMGGNRLTDVGAPTSGTDAARLDDIGQGFYGINVGQSDDAAIFKGVDTIKFEAANFYVTQNAPNTDEVQVNFRGGITDHGDLAGLDDDDHTQYTLADGTRAFTGDQSMGSNRLTNVGAPTTGTDAARLDDIGPGFYGINVGQSDDSAIFKGIDTIKFEVANFYVTQNDPNTDEVQVNFRGSGGVTDHGDLAGLADDDHTQYTLEDGTRAFSGDQSMGSNRLTNVGAPTADTDAARLQDIGPGFYGINVGQSDDSVIFTGIETVKFETANFYVTQNDPNTDEVQVNFREGEAADVVALGGLGRWNYNVNTTLPANSQQIRFDNLDWTLATELSIAHLALGGVDVENFLDSIQPGALLYIQKKNNSDDFTVVEVNSNTNTGSANTFGIAAVAVFGNQPSSTGIELFVFVGGSSPRDHGDLDGLADDDHPQYAEIANAETITGLWGFTTHPTGLDHTAIANIGTNTHAQIDTHIADATIHFTEASIDHGSIGGLADDDHAQYLFLAGRAGGQTAIGGTAINERLDLQGSTHANRGQIFTNGRVQMDYDWTTDAGDNALTWANTIALSGVAVSFMIAMANTVTVDEGTFIPGAFRDTSHFEWITSPGFAVVTLFLSQPRLFSTTPGVAPANTFVFAAQPTYESFGAGAITSGTFRGVSSAVILRARNAFDTMTLGSNHGLVFTGLWNVNDGDAIIDFGDSAAVKVLDPTFVLFGQSLGIQRCVNWYGIDYDNITITTTGERAVVHSSLVASGINYFLKNDGGADSDHGTGDLHFDDAGGVVLGTGDDVRLAWDNALGVWNWEPAVGEDLVIAFGFDGSKPTYLFEAETFGDSETDYTQIRFGFDRYAFGQTGSIGNQVGLFIAPNRTVDVAGGWSDYLLTQGGNLDIGTFAMSDVAAWTINQISLDNTAGSIASLDTLVIGGMTTSNPGITVTERAALRVTGRLKQRGSVQYPPIDPSALSAGDNDDWAGLLTGSPNNNGRYWARITGNATTSTITGIDATAVQDGDTFELTNVGTENLLVENEGTGSSAANRIITGQGGSIAPNFVLSADRSMTLRYDGTDSRWRVLTPPGAVAPLSGHWRFSTTTTMADPGSGTFRNNNGTLASVTSIALSDISFRGGDASAIIASLASGDQFYIQNESNAAEFMVFNITATTDNTTWWQIDGTAGDVGTAFSNNAEFNIIAIFA